MGRKFFLGLALLLATSTTVAYGKEIEGMVLSISKGKVVVITKDGKKKELTLSIVGNKVSSMPRPGSIVILTIQGNLVKEIKIKRIPQ